MPFPQIITHKSTAIATAIISHRFSLDQTCLIIFALPSLFSVSLDKSRTDRLIYDSSSSSLQFCLFAHKHGWSEFLCTFHGSFRGHIEFPFILTCGSSLGPWDDFVHLFKTNCLFATASPSRAHIICISFKVTVKGHTKHSRLFSLCWILTGAFHTPLCACSPSLCLQAPYYPSKRLSAGCASRLLLLRDQLALCTDFTHKVTLSLARPYCIYR